MDLNNCPLCGNLCPGKRAACSKCQALEENLYQQVELYLFDHDEADAAEVAANTRVTLSDLEFLLKRGRLQSYERLAYSILRCLRCRDPIARGQYCESCASTFKVKVHAMLDAGTTPCESAPRAAELADFNRRDRQGPTSGLRSDYWRERVRR